MIQLDNTVEKFKKIILEELAEEGIICWIAGGSVRDHFMGLAEANTDYDLFFPNETEFDSALDYFRNLDGVQIKWESNNGVKLVYNNRTFDLVKKFFNNPQETIDAFDFTVSMFAVDMNKVYWGESSFIDLAKRQLMINKITYAASSLSRAFRYMKKGFSICKEETAKLFFAIQDEALVEENSMKEKISFNELLEVRKQRREEMFFNNNLSGDLFRGID